MLSSSLRDLVCRLRQSAQPRQHDLDSDAELLERFRVESDPEAFAAIVRRHGGGVLSACRKVLSCEADVEDAFQATFLVLLRNSRSIRQGQALAGWLRGVAHRIALKALAATARRQRAEQQKPPPEAEMVDLSVREACTILHQELDRLPEKYRLPLLLCYLEGKTRDEAAQQLGWKLSVVRGRLKRGRDRLRDRLTRRGVSLSVGLLAALGNSVTADVLSSHLVRSTLAAATEDAIPATVAALLHGAAPAMTLKIKVFACLVLAVGLISGGFALRMRGAPPEETSRLRFSAEPRELVADNPKASLTAPQDETTATLECRGQVLDPDGKPVAGAKVTFQQRRPHRELPEFFPEPSLGTTDADGRFQLPATFHKDSPNRGYEPGLVLTALAPGFGPAATEVKASGKPKEHVLRLVKDDVPIQGRIRDLEGKPIAGVTVRPISVVACAANDLGPWQKVWGKGRWNTLDADHRPELVFSPMASGLTQKAVTDASGKFTLSGFGRERLVVLRIDGPTIETTLVNVTTRQMPTLGDRELALPAMPSGGFPRPPARQMPASGGFPRKRIHGASFEYAAGPTLVVEGVVRDQDSSQPIAGVRISRGIDYEFGWAEDTLATTTGADGSYRLVGLPRRARETLWFVPPTGQPYLAAAQAPALTGFGKPARLDVGLKRGVLVKGRVTDKATGKPVQAIVEYFAFLENPHLKQVKGFQGSQAVSSSKDGSFVLTALPGRGIVAGKTDEMQRTRYLSGQGAGRIPGLDKEDLFPTAPYLCWRPGFKTLIGIEPDARAESVTCDLQLDPGKTVKGTLLDPAGKPLTGVRIQGPFLSLVEARDLPTAQFTLTAINPARPEAYFFTHHQKKLGAAALLKGDEPEGFTVQLQPGATVTGRFVTEDGEPVRNAQIQGWIEAGQLNLTRKWNGFFWAEVDEKGRFEITGLLPGIRLGAVVEHGTEHVVDNLFQNQTFKPGEVRALGDVKLKRMPE